MAKKGKPVQFGHIRKQEKIKPIKGRLSLAGRDILRRDEHLRIAPGHPGMGRR
jgi:hypothetical protein